MPLLCPFSSCFSFPPIFLHGVTAGDGHIYAQCAILIHVPEYGSEERDDATSAAYDIAYDSTLPVEAYTHTRAGMTMEMEEQTARARFEEYSRKHPSAGLKKPKMPKRGRRGRGGWDDDDDEDGMYGYGMMGGMFGMW